RGLGAVGLACAAGPTPFAVGLAARLRAQGVELEADRERFTERRRVKNERELAGVRRAQRAAEAGMGVAADLLRDWKPNGAPLTSERLKAAIAQAFIDH